MVRPNIIHRKTSRGLNSQFFSRIKPLLGKTCAKQTAQQQATHKCPLVRLLRLRSMIGVIDELMIREIDDSMIGVIDESRNW